MSPVLAEYRLGDMVVQYSTGRTVGLRILPEGLVWADHGEVDPLVHLSVQGGAACGGFVAGHSQRGSPAALEFVDHRVDQQGDETVITTRFDLRGVEVRHLLCHTRGSRVLRTRTEVSHRGTEALGLEMLSSFSLGGLSPLPGGTDPGALTVHRIRSTWSNEGRVVSELAEDLQLEPSWTLHGVRVERFGQVGSLPVRKFFPFVAVEDRAQAVVWAAQVATPGSWQIELWRRGRTLGVSGGLADWEFGHWTKVLAPGDDFVTPWAHLTVGRGNLDEVSQRLIDVATRPTQNRLPQVFNEFCSTWGRPSEASVGAQVEALRGRGLDYFVIDAGWYAHPEHGWEQNHGDWEVAAHLFPEGLKPVVDTIRGAGMVPGLWFELETCGPLSMAFQNTDHLLKRGGHTLTSGARRFWDMRDPWVRDYLGQKVLGPLSQGFGYIKVDYNESFGVGCGDSPGEGLRLQLEATQEFFRELRRAGLVIENCASGGHRLEPSMLALSDFSSFSDAHECPEIPVLAANLHRVVPPWQCQIWAVIRHTDSPQRIVYSLAASFLGVLCLSGDVEKLDATQWRWVDQGLAFHRRIDALVVRGTTHFQGPHQTSYRRLVGWQAIVRVDGDEALVVAHGFEGCDTVVVTLPWPVTIADAYGQIETRVVGHRLSIDLVPWSAVALRVVRS